MSNKEIIVCGGGGFVGGHLVRNLLQTGTDPNVIRVVDIKPLDEWFQLFPEVENIQADLQRKDACDFAVKGAREIINLSCNMGGMGFIENNRALCMISVLINTHLLLSAKEFGVEKYFYSSSACVYNTSKQQDPNVTALKEEDAYPSLPEAGYGEEKLLSERMCQFFREDFGINTVVARFHNSYGTYGSYTGGREKAPAAICRKVAEAKLSGNHQIEIWGNGQQTRSFMYIDDNIQGINMLMKAGHPGPINLGSNQLVTINQLVDLVEEIAEIKLERSYNLTAPRGVAGRNSDNTLIKKLFNWEPSTRLEDGIAKTYAWIYRQVRNGMYRK